MLATGIRRGELLKLKLSHLPFGPKATLTVERSPDDKEDVRRNEPQVKSARAKSQSPNHSPWNSGATHRNTVGRGAIHIYSQVIVGESHSMQRA